MPTEDEARGYARLIGIMYGIVIAMELYGDKPVSYAEIERIMDEQQHCSPVRLRDVCKELHRFNALIAEVEKNK